MPGAN